VDSVDSLGMNLRSIRAEGELRPETAHTEFSSVCKESSRLVSGRVEKYDLDAIILIGCHGKGAPTRAVHRRGCASILSYIEV